MALLLVLLVIIIALISIFINIKKIKRGNPRNPLRIVSVVMASYIFIVYSLFGAGIISQAELASLLRWFWSVVMIYLIAEGENG